MWLDLSLVLSGPSLFDKAALEPTLYSMFSKNSCESKIRTLQKNGVVGAKERIQKDCKKPKLHGQTEDFEYWHCPCQFPHPQAGLLLTLATNIKNGILPFEGGYCDQPSNVMECISIVQSFLIEEEERQQKKQEAAQKTRRK